MLKDVDDASLGRLLDLQGEDSTIKRLQLQRASLPEAERLARVKSVLAELESDLEIANKQFEEIGREQARIEGEIRLVEAKIAKEEKRLFSGAVANPRELSALQAEVEMLKRKRAAGEDSLLEVMVQRDDAQSTRERLVSERQEASTEAEQLTATVADLTSDIDAQLTRHEAARHTIVSELPKELVGLYEQVRDSKGGVGAAALVGGACQGCHTQLPAKEVERLRAASGVQRCENCRRILVVT
jgi:predicted  nucleic acid-binding Zn-ribbon protein